MRMPRLCLPSPLLHAAEDPDIILIPVVEWIAKSRQPGRDLGVQVGKCEVPSPYAATLQAFL